MRILYGGSVKADNAAAIATGDPFWRRASRWLLLGGLVSGVAASAVGLSTSTAKTLLGKKGRG